ASRTLSTCLIKDLNSKYGTHIVRNGDIIRVPNEEIEVQPSDILKFGLQQHIYTVEYIPFITVVSRLSPDDGRELKIILDNIGGRVADSLDSYCTHLTVTNATSTEKVISALISGIPIVDVRYWKRIVSAIDSSANLPDPDDFVLPLRDRDMNAHKVCLKPDKARKSLFSGKSFIFLSEDSFAKNKKMIHLAGGEAKKYILNSTEVPEYFFDERNIIVQLLEYDDSVHSSTIIVKI
ncbi:hypothetical protein QAD02_002132, partial [Eretmocerus hayati]